MQNTELASAIRPRPVLAARHLMLLRPLAMPSAIWYVRSLKDIEDISTSMCSLSVCTAIMARRSPSSMSEAYCSPFEYQILASTGAHARTSWPSAG